MIILFFLLAIAILIGVVKADPDDGGFLFIFTIGAVVCTFVAGMVLLSSVVNDGRIIEEKLAMYEQENQKIEQVVDAATKEYLGYESKVYDNIGDKSDVVTTVAMYPELASSEIVKEQIKLYESNNEKIKQLKEDRIDLGRDKWWLYFGK